MDGGLFESQSKLVRNYLGARPGRVRASSYPKKTIDLELIEHNLRDRLISAFGVSPAQGISPAEVYRNSHI